MIPIDIKTATAYKKINTTSTKGHAMHPLITPVTSIIAGVLILIFPTILNYVVAFYLILMGVIALLN